MKMNVHRRLIVNILDLGRGLPPGLLTSEGLLALFSTLPYH